MLQQKSNTQPSPAMKPEDLVYSRYTPINYSEAKPWGPGDNILPLLTSLARDVWERALPYQDKREDPGQGELVTYFAIKLSELAGISETDREIITLAAILHDTGYASMERINERFRASLAKGISISNNEELRKIRIEHQEHSINFARKFIPDYPGLKEVSTIIGDHDTRFNPPTGIGRFMWDADILWRFTVPCYEAYHRQKEEAKVFEFLLAQLYQPGHFHTPFAIWVGRLELSNTMKCVLGVENLPTEFKKEFERELMILSSKDLFEHK